MCDHGNVLKAPDEFHLWRNWPNGILPAEESFSQIKTKRVTDKSSVGKSFRLVAVAALPSGTVFPLYLESLFSSTF